MATLSICGGAISSRRGLLASLWTLLTSITAVAFLVALIFTLSESNKASQNSYYEYDGQQRQQQRNEADPEVAVTSRAMAFAALWTAVLATLLAIFGTVVLGWQSPTGQYYTCCSPQVHRTTPIAMGSFIGALFMFANLTLVCSVLFGEFEVRVSIAETAKFSENVISVPLIRFCLLTDSCRLALLNVDKRLQRGRRSRKG